MGDITANFSCWEFAPKMLGAERKNWKPLPVQAVMIRHMAVMILQPIRDEFGEVNITSGVRTLTDYTRLIDAGYHPSWKSDHYFGACVPVPVTHQPQFGASFPWTCGAVDIQVNDHMRDAFHWMQDKLDPGRYGQIIYEVQTRADGTEAHWIHIGNPRLLVYSAAVADTLPVKTPVLMGINGRYTRYER